MAGEAIRAASKCDIREHFRTIARLKLVGLRLLKEQPGFGGFMKCQANICSQHQQATALAEALLLHKLAPEGQCCFDGRLSLLSVERPIISDGLA